MEPRATQELHAPSVERQQLAQAGLTLRQTECLALHFYEGLTTRRIASLLGTCQSVVARHLQRGLRRLKAADLTPRPVTMAPPNMTWMDTETLDKIADDAVLALW